MKIKKYILESVNQSTEFNSVEHKITYNPENSESESYFLNKETVERVMKFIRSLIKDKKDYAVLAYIKLVERVHMQFAKGQVAADKRRETINKAKDDYKKLYKSCPKTTPIYKGFYEVINGGPLSLNTKSKNNA